MARETTTTSPGLIQIWQEAFNEDLSYIHFFLKFGLPLGTSLTIGPSNHPYAALTLFPISLRLAGVSYSGYYLYALGTLLLERNKGYATKLVQKAASFALETGLSFILLQPTHHALFAYYAKLGYHTPVYRSYVKFSRTNLLFNNNLDPFFQCLSHLAVPCETIHLQNRFEWSLPMREYMQKECLFRGGVVIHGSFCYPNSDVDGHFIEVKEFPMNALPSLVSTLLSTFPHHERFIFYGKPNQTELQVKQEPFALVHFLDPQLSEQYNPHCYFGLGLD